MRTHAKSVADLAVKAGQLRQGGGYPRRDAGVYGSGLQHSLAEAHGRSKIQLGWHGDGQSKELARQLLTMLSWSTQHDDERSQSLSKHLAENYRACSSMSPQGMVACHFPIAVT